MGSTYVQLLGYTDGMDADPFERLYFVEGLTNLIAEYVAQRWAPRALATCKAWRDIIHLGYRFVLCGVCLSDRGYGCRCGEGEYSDSSSGPEMDVNEDQVD